jgi:hypothetical protein
MNILRFILIGIAAGSTLYASAATVTKAGVPLATHPHGISLRQESVRHSPGYIHVMGRGHYGGGIRSHK